MRILVVGAYGLIGGYVTARLLAEKHSIIGVGRDVATAKRRFPAAQWVAADLRAMTTAEWEPLLAGVDAVVNCAGALQDSPRDDLEAVHQRAVSALAHACRAKGVRRFVHVSAVGVESGRDRFRQTKRAADEVLRSTDLEWVILRPAVVLAPAAYGGSALLRGLAAFPGYIPVLNPDAVIQTTDVEDITEAVVRSLDGPARFTCDLTASELTRVQDILVALRGWLGLPPATVIALPRWIGRLGAALADSVAWLGWRSPMRSAALAQLSAGVRGRSSDAMEQLGFHPRELAEWLERRPSGVQERWYARLYFLKPLVIAILAAFWAISGIVGFVSQAAAVRLLTDVEMSRTAAETFVLAGSVADLALAVLVIFRRSAPLALKGMVLLTVAYLAGATFWLPHLWSDPLGPLVKSIPAAALALVALAIMDER